MNGTHRESHDDACPLLLLLSPPPAPASPYRSSPANRLFPKASALYFYSFLPLSFLPAAKRSAIFSPLFISFARLSPQHAFRAGIRRTFSRSKQNAPPLPASPRLFFFLSPQSRPPVVTSLSPLGLSRLCFSFPQSFLYRRKKAAKKVLPLRKRLLSSALPDPANKKTFSERTLKRFPFKMDQTNSMMTRRAASPLRGSSFMIRV